MASDSEIAKSLQRLSDEYEDLKRFKSNFQSQLDNIASSLDDISRRAHSIETQSKRLTSTVTSTTLRSL